MGILQLPLAVLVTWRGPQVSGHECGEKSLKFATVLYSFKWESSFCLGFRKLTRPLFSLQICLLLSSSEGEKSSGGNGFRSELGCMVKILPNCEYNFRQRFPQGTLVVGGVDSEIWSRTPPKKTSNKQISVSQHRRNKTCVKVIARAVLNTNQLLIFSQSFFFLHVPS